MILLILIITFRSPDIAPVEHFPYPTKEFAVKSREEAVGILKREQWNLSSFEGKPIQWANGELLTINLSDKTIVSEEIRGLDAN